MATQQSEKGTQGVLVIGGSDSAALRHEVPIGLPDLNAYAECGGKRYALVWPFEVAAIQKLGLDLEVISLGEFGIFDVLAETGSLDTAVAESVARACQHLGLVTALAPSDFPLGAAEVLRRRGIELQVDPQCFEARRRSKTPTEIAGIRRAILAAEAGVSAMCERISSGEPVTCDELRVVAWSTYPAHDAQPHSMLLVASGPETSDAHAEGEGLIEPHQPILIDTLARDRSSGCWADFSRTVCLGSPPERLQQCHEDVKEAASRARAAARPGVTLEDLERIAAAYLSEQGHLTRFETEDGELPEEGLIHGTGHGVGLEIHEPPFSQDDSVLVKGDVVTIEPGVYYKGFGGVRIEDMLLITDDGHEVLTKFPYDLELPVGAIQNA